MNGWQWFGSPVAFELFENLLLAFVFAGVLCNVAAGHGLVSFSVVPAGTALTTALFFALLSFDTVMRFSAQPPRPLE